jgi:hypothetical protein
MLYDNVIAFSAAAELILVRAQADERGTYVAESTTYS